MSKIICKFHKDTEASMHVYQDTGFGHCFVCGAHVKIEGVNDKVKTKRSPTDIKAKMEYIQTLPIRRIRGLDFPCDESGFYIRWPSSEFYKRRNFTGKERYTGPRGLKPMLFAYVNGGDKLVIIEGEINALTVYTMDTDTIYKGYSLCSPGAASELKRHINEYLKYKKIWIIVDHDPAGIAHGIELKEMLLKHKKCVTLITRTQDYNDLLQEKGPEAVREAFRRDIHEG